MLWLTWMYHTVSAYPSQDHSMVSEPLFRLISLFQKCRIPCRGPCQFITALNKLDKYADGGGIVFWLDYTKFGRVSNNDLNETLDLVKTGLSRQPEKSVAFIVCPHLISEKVQVQNNLRGEIRTDCAQKYSKFSTHVSGRYEHVVMFVSIT